MHWVDRGPEPFGLDHIRKLLTPAWVTYYRNQVGEKPSGSRWQDFSCDLSSRFHGNCGYCEEYAGPGRVDHFRPKSRFPELVYAWSNWVYACNKCNVVKKKDKWPSSGYVNPCACSFEDRPENFFDFDLHTGDIVARLGLTEEQHRKAWQTIDDLGLNDKGHKDNRRARIKEVRMLLAFLDEFVAPDIEHFLRTRARHRSELSSVTRAVLEESGHSVEPG